MSHPSQPNTRVQHGTRQNIPHHDTQNIRDTLEGEIRSAMIKEAGLSAEELPREIIINRLHSFMHDDKTKIEGWLDRGFPKEAYDRLISDGLGALSAGQPQRLHRFNQALLLCDQPKGHGR